jgi:hypothetical protein
MWRALGALVFLLRFLLPGWATAETGEQSELLERLKRLEENQTKLYELLKEKDRRLEALEAEIKRTKQTEAQTPVAPTQAEAPKPAAEPTRAEAPKQPPPPLSGPPIADVPAPSGSEADMAKAPPPKEAPRQVGIYVPGRGFALARDQWGELNFGVYTYLRFLEQKGLNSEYTNGFGETVKLDRREDLQLNKVKLEFRGWLIDPRFQYVLYTWTNQTSQGLGAQVVVGGNLNWVVNDALKVGGGILSLPTTRSTQGSFPYWLTVDHRTLADEFFRGSYTQGFYAYGGTHGVGYYAMLANNLSTLGVPATQLDPNFTTFSGALWWNPTTGEFGPRQGFGDYEMHEKLATRLGVHFTFSPEDRQEQPNETDFDNSQIRLSNGTNVFTTGALAPKVTVQNVTYNMADFDAGLKYRGFALEGEYYLRWLNDFRADGPVPVTQVFDDGFQLLASAMIVPKTLQLYTMGSYIFGDFGDAWEMTGGLNWFPFRRRELRLNLEYIYDHKSPTGGPSYPQVVGGTGSIFLGNLELSF